eukprot:gene24886-biopygen23931
MKLVDLLGKRSLMGRLGMPPTPEGRGKTRKHCDMCRDRRCHHSVRARQFGILCGGATTAALNRLRVVPAQSCHGRAISGKWGDRDSSRPSAALKACLQFPIVTWSPGRKSVRGAWRISYHRGRE